MKASIAAAVLLLSITLAPAPARSGTPAADPGHSHMNWSARKVADHIGCKGFYPRPATSLFISTGICWQEGQRINIMTFRNEGQQVRYAGFLGVMRPRFWLAFGRGAIIVAKDGNRPAAVVGRRALGSAQVIQARNFA